MVRMSGDAVEIVLNEKRRRRRRARPSGKQARPTPRKRPDRGRSRSGSAPTSAARAAVAFERFVTLSWSSPWVGMRNLYSGEYNFVTTSSFLRRHGRAVEGYDPATNTVAPCNCAVLSGRGVASYMNDHGFGRTRDYAEHAARNNCVVVPIVDRDLLRQTESGESNGVPAEAFRYRFAGAVVVCMRQAKEGDGCYFSYHG